MWYHKYKSRFSLQQKCSKIYWTLLAKAELGWIKPDQCEVNCMWFELTYAIETLVRRYWIWFKPFLSHCLKCFFPIFLRIWSPDMLLFNSASTAFNNAFPTNVIVHSNGDCRFIPPGIFLSTCQVSKLRPFSHKVTQDMKFHTSSLWF